MNEDEVKILKDLSQSLGERKIPFFFEFVSNDNKKLKTNRLTNYSQHMLFYLSANIEEDIRAQIRHDLLKRENKI